MYLPSFKYANHLKLGSLATHYKSVYLFPVIRRNYCHRQLDISLENITNLVLCNVALVNVAQNNPHFSSNFIQDGGIEQSTPAMPRHSNLLCQW